MTTHLFHGDYIDIIKGLEPQSIDHVITDPMYDDPLDMSVFQHVLKPHGNIIMFCAPLKPFFMPTHLCYWEKPAAPKNTAKQINQSTVEWILILNRPGNTYHGDLFWANFTGVFHDVLLEKPVHPYQKPISLMERLVAIYTNPGDVILDPFFGSGSTLKAAQRLNRNCIGIEKEKKYFEMMETL